MEKLKKHIQNAFAILLSVSVKGDDVDFMAAARQELRHALAEAARAEEEIKKSEEETKDG